MQRGQKSAKGRRVSPNEKMRVQLLTTPELPRDKDEALSAFPPDRGISEPRVNEGR